MRISDWSSDVCSSDLGGHLSHRRRARRRFLRIAAFRAAQQLAGQCQSRQGAPPALADQAEIWPEAELGGPDDPGGQCRHRVDGRPGLWLRRRRSEEHTSELQSLMRISYAVFCLNKKTT